MRSFLLSLVALDPCIESLVGEITQEAALKKPPIPIYVTPYYDSKGLQIEVGPFSKELAAATDGTVRELITKMKKERDTLPIEAMYVVSIRLYDFGLKDDAVYWFHSATYRARLFQSIVPRTSIGNIGDPGFEHTQAYGAFHTLAGEYINGYAFGDLAKLKKTIELVKSENEKIPKFKLIYPKQSFVPDESWPAKNKEIAAGLDKLLDYIAKNADEIKATRKKNGIEGKY
jgi:hypothetical protein